LPKNELLAIFYNGLTVESKTYLDSCAGCVFRKRTPAEAKELMAKISRNHLLENSIAITKLQDIVERTSNDVKMLVKHF
jgi:hypothetical protein